ncbi:MAG: DNA repair protein RecO [Proteobacteria bacterium]|nr:DNA repair protein RecO [Pseudomonadota bacterium]
MAGAQRVHLEPAFLLHQRDWRDSSRIVEFLTRDHGRVALFAKGVRRARSPLGAVLQPFAPLLVSWAGPGDGGTLTGAELAGVPRAVAGPCLMSGFYLNELVLKLLARVDPHPDVYEAYALALGALAQAAAEERALRLFEKRLLEALGLGLDYAHLVADGTRVAPERYYDVEPSRGVLGAVAAGAAEACLGADLLALAAEELASPGSLATARRLLRAALEHALDGREIESRRVARAVRRARAGTEEQGR